MDQSISLMKKIRGVLKKQKLIYFLFDSYRQMIVRQQLKAEENIPLINLKEENISNLKTITNREELIRQLPQHKVIAEIGVNRGEFSEVLLKIAEPKKLHLIDSWEGGRYPMELRD